MIWGLTLEPGKVYTEIVQDEVQLSMASLECRRDTSDNEGNFSHIVMTTNNAEYLLCTLVNGATYQQNLDLKIMPQEKVAFSVQGASTVYLMGYSTVYPGIDQELDTGEDQSIPGWQEYSIDENQEDNIVSVDNTYSPLPNATPEQYAELTSSNTSSRDGKLSSSKLSLQESQRTSPKPSSEGGLVSSEDLLVEDWTVEPQEDDEPDYIVESVKAEQVEDVEAVFPVADIDVKEEPSSPVASLSNPSSSETVMGTPGSLSNLELQSYQPGEESSHTVSSSWLVQIPEDTNSSSRLSVDEQEFTSDVDNNVSGDGILKIIEQPAHQRMTEVEEVQNNLQPIASTGHYSLNSPDFSGNQGTKSIVSWSPSLSTSTTDAYHYQILPNAKQQSLHLSRGRHSAVQKNSRKGRPSQTLGRYQLAPARGQRVKSRGLSSRGLSHKYHQLNARGGLSQGTEANQPLPVGLTGSFQTAGSPSLSSMGSSSTVPYHADGTNLYSNQSPRAASHSRVGTTQSKHHVCEICQKSFVTMSLLKRHQVIHTGLKPHKCPMCPSSFARNDNLLRHLKNNHKEAYMYFRGGLKNS
ncbi:uncharacterized protein [Apostichopus japonicus]|uniref:uncharacterized protein isoform X1 n=2 Tax=Stichopus japonicus TaxID=307972 RepID=UPI003AB38326